MIDRSAFEAAWDRTFGEQLDTGIERVKLLMKRFDVMERYERGHRFSGGTRMSDGDFARVALLAAIGVATLTGEWPEQLKQLPEPQVPRVEDQNLSG